MEYTNAAMEKAGLLLRIFIKQLSFLNTADDM